MRPAALTSSCLPAARLAVGLTGGVLTRGARADIVRICLAARRRPKP